MKALLTMAIVAGSMLTCIACGNASTHSGQVPAASITTASKPAIAPIVIAPLAKLGLNALYRDEDDEDTRGEEIGHNPNDSDADGDNDRPRLGYYDHDDSNTRNLGHAASPADRHALISLTRHYYAAAAAENGAAACALLSPSFAKIVPEDYGHDSAGPSYLRAGTTCATVATLLFQHFHAKLSVPIEIIRTRVEGTTALVLIGAANMPASDLEARREAGAWRSVGLLASSLP